MKRIASLILFIIGITNVQAQKGALWSFGINPYYGGVLKYKPEMKQLEYTNLHGIELYAVKSADGSKNWHKYFNYPQWGLAASYVDYGVPDELGQIGSLATYLDFTKGKKKHKWRINIGTGIVYSNTRFDSLTNVENKAISSKISYVLRGTIHKEFQFNDKWYFNVNLAFRHYSNGKLNMPNNGMNYPMVGVGLRYAPRTFEMKNLEWPERTVDPKVHYTLRGSISWREVWQEDIKHKAYSLSFYSSKQLSKYNNLLLGVDAFNYDQKSVDNANVVYLQKEGLSLDTNLNRDTRQLALTIGTELLISRATVVVQGGIYVYRPQVYYSGWYQRYGLKYNLTEFLFSQVSLRAHGRTADMMEFGLGLTL